MLAQVRSARAYGGSLRCEVGSLNGRVKRHDQVLEHLFGRSRMRVLAELPRL